MIPEMQIALEASSESILLAFAIRDQMIKTCEEMGELTTEICKRLNNSPTSNDALIDEIADVFIMVYQMRKAFGEKAVDERIIFKLNRTMEFIRKRQDSQRISSQEGVV